MSVLKAPQPKLFVSRPSGVDLLLAQTPILLLLLPNRLFGWGFIETSCSVLFVSPRSAQSEAVGSIDAFSSLRSENSQDICKNSEKYSKKLRNIGVKIGSFNYKKIDF